MRAITVAYFLCLVLSTLGGEARAEFPSDGIPIVASPAVSAQAREELLRLLDGLAYARPGILDPYKTMPGFRIVIRGIGERTQDLPDVIAYPSVRNWVISVGGDTRVGGGFGCSPSAPITVVSEQNLLRLTWDPWFGESVALHEIVHMFLTCLPPAGLRSQVTSAFNSARASGLWLDTYADDTVDEYWAEGVQSYFETNLQASPANGIHNHVNTRAELAAYDPTLYYLIANFFAYNPWTYSAPVPTPWKAFSTWWLGTGKRLDVINDGINNRIQLANAGYYSGQYWRQVNVGGGYFRMKNAFTGDSRCLDVINDGVNDKLHLTACGNYSGQHFRKVDSGYSGYYFLKTRFTGDGKCLDVINDGINNRLRLAPCGYYGGQLWRILNP